MRKVFAIATALLVLAGGLAPAAAASPAAASPAAAAASPAAASSASATPADVGPVSTSAVGDDVPTSTNASNATTAPADPAEDRLGWEEVDGYGIWYNESIDVDNSDGLTRDELDKLVARTMARVEYVRKLEFEGSIPVDIRSREAYAENVTGQYANISQKGKVHQNVKYEATFMIPEQQDAIDQLASNRAASTLGYYSPTQDEIVIISDNTSVLQMDELTLSHELAHAVQDQHFNITRYNQTTEDTNNGVSGLIEGDAHYTETIYTRNCNNQSHSWNGTCIRPSGSASAGGGGDFNIGIYLISYQPYSDGPNWVNGLYEEGGWEAVNDAYDNPPASSEQTIHPEKYPEDEPADIEVEDRSNEDWKILNLGNGSVNYATFGEAGLFSMFWYPSYKTSQAQGRAVNVVLPYNHLFQGTQGNPYDAYNYNADVTNGWDGDKLYPYVRTGEDPDYNRTGYVWKMEWDTEADAEQFVQGYDELLKHYDATEVDGRKNTYTVPDGEKFGDAYYVERSGTTVWIVNAPSVDELSAVREGAAPQVEGMTTTSTSDDETTTTAGSSDGTTATAGGDDTTTDDGTTTANQPGFGVVVALAALLAAALFAATRRRE